MSRSLVKGRADENFLKPHTKLYLEVAPPWVLYKQKINIYMFHTHKYHLYIYYTSQYLLYYSTQNQGGATSK